MEWNGMEWNGTEWNGMERNGSIFFIFFDVKSFDVTRHTSEELRARDVAGVVLLHLPHLADVVGLDARLVRVPHADKCQLHVDVDLLGLGVEHGFGRSRELGDFGEKVAVVEARRVGVREHYYVRMGWGRRFRRGSNLYRVPFVAQNGLRRKSFILDHKKSKILKIDF